MRKILATALCFLLVALTVSSGHTATAPVKKTVAAKAPAALAPQVALLGTFGQWHAYKSGSGDKLICYMDLSPNLPAIPKMKRDPVHLMITHRPGENSLNVFSYDGGYTYKPTSSVTAHIGATSYDLFTSGDTAWGRDATADRTLSKAIQGGGAITLVGTPVGKNGANPKPVTDHFSLVEADKAYIAISKACGVATPPAKKVAKTRAKNAPKTKKSVQ